MIILETSRLYLKTIEKEDSQVLHDLIFSDEETMQYTFLNRAFSPDETKKFIYQNFCKNNANVGLAPLFEKKSGQIVGIAGVLKNETLGKSHYELGVIITKEFRKNGFALEVANAQVTFIKKILRQKNAYALVSKDNNASKNLLNKVGMSFEKNVQLKDRGEKEVYTKKV